MKRVFRVAVHYRDQTRNEYRVEAKDDLQARDKAISIDGKAWPEDGVGFPGIAYCEIEHLCSLDG